MATDDSADEAEEGEGTGVEEVARGVVKEGAAMVEEEDVDVGEGVVMDEGEVGSMEMATYLPCQHRRADVVLPVVTKWIWNGLGLLSVNLIANSHRPTHFFSWRNDLISQAM